MSFSGRFTDTTAHEEIVVILLVICFIVYEMFMLNDCRSGDLSARVWAWDKAPQHAPNKASSTIPPGLIFTRRYIGSGSPGEAPHLGPLSHCNQEETSHSPELSLPASTGCGSLPVCL